MKEFLFFVSGVVVGAAAAALFTPMTGEELRARIRQILIEKGVIASDEIEDFVERIALEIEEEGK